MEVHLNRKDLIKNISARLYEKLKVIDKESLFNFIDQYYSPLIYHDIKKRSLEELSSLALNFWNFFSVRPPHTPKVRVYDTVLDKVSTSPLYTTVEINHDNMPFLIDTVRMLIQRRKLNIHFMIHSPNGINIKRNEKHQITAVLPPFSTEKDFQWEATIYLQIDKITETSIQNHLAIELKEALTDIRYAVQDWKLIVQKAELLKEKNQFNPPQDLAFDEQKEAKAFLSWLINDHFIFLGYGTYQFKKRSKLNFISNSALGIYRQVKIQHALNTPKHNTPTIHVTKTNLLSTIHRNTYIDSICVTTSDTNGNLIEVHHFIGLFRNAVYRESSNTIPLIRHKIEAIFKQSQLTANTYSGKLLLDILNTLPKDDLFQGAIKELYPLCIQMMRHAQAQEYIKLFIRKDSYKHYLSGFIFTPLKYYTNRLQQQFQLYLESLFNSCEILIQPYFDESSTVKIHFLIRFAEPFTRMIWNLRKIELQLNNLAQSWEDRFLQALKKIYSKEKSDLFFKHYKQGFSKAYQEKFSPEMAVQDIPIFEQLEKNKGQDIELIFSHERSAELNQVQVKIFKFHAPLSLDSTIPIFKNLGLIALNETAYSITQKDGQLIWIQCFDVQAQRPPALVWKKLFFLLNIAFKLIWKGQQENDAFNQLVLSSALSIEKIVVLRAIAKYAKQIHFQYDQVYIEQTLLHYPLVARNLFNLFEARFKPDLKNRSKIVSALEKQLQAEFEKIKNLNEDKVFRFYFTLIKVMLRTNYFQKDEKGSRSYLSFKLATQAIPGLAPGQPKFEIFVYSIEFEAVHLRMNKIARGGIRWSDRPEDFRTEILSLMNTQQVKNALIVPEGAKGGFYPKLKQPDSKLDYAFGVECYKKFINALLELTDNVQATKGLPPLQTVCYDEEDAYLVVAADKGTASFSDLANQISEKYDFWLKDAFASGGSNGYNHKTLGITAKGAWESVKQHFHRLNINPTDPISTVGIGDMSGDVFGNGMLYSESIQLIAAFDHRHIFIDPNPDPVQSFQERKRLFKLPRSSWGDYNRQLISKGGGVFERTIKSITLSPEIKNCLQISANQLEPNQLIQAILRAPVDLLWNGGIGTYVKSSQELHVEIGDKLNDFTRIDANELRCRVVGEGGNLGFTHQARIEYALKKGAIYTDFIDNAGGVNCSDHEVNLKILFNELIQVGRLNERSRKRALLSVEKEIERLILQDNRRQAQAIDFMHRRLTPCLETTKTYLHYLIEQKILNKKLNFLPSETILDQRLAAHQDLLTYPELAVIFAYTKIHLKQTLLKAENGLANSDALPYVLMAFPPRIQKRFPEFIAKHRLYRELGITQLTNHIMNGVGTLFIYQLHLETGAADTEVINKYLTMRHILKLEIAELELQDTNASLDGEKILNLKIVIAEWVKQTTGWLIRRFPNQANSTIEKKFSNFIPFLIKTFYSAIPAHLKKSITTLLSDYRKMGFSTRFSLKLSLAQYTVSAFNILNMADRHKVPPSALTKAYFKIGEKLNLFELKSLAEKQHSAQNIDSVALAAFFDQLDTLQTDLALQFFIFNENRSASSGLWEVEHSRDIYHCNKEIQSLKESKLTPNGSALFVVLKELSDLLRTR